MSKFLDALQNRILVLDGSMGALLQNRGLPAGMAPDLWMMDNPDVILGAHREYVEAGADILLTNTFGASKWRLAEYDAHSRIREINARAVDIARKAAGGRAFVAGDIGPSGETIYPTGKRSFEEAAEVFYEQARILVELGVDLIVIETMFDSLEYRAACSAVRAASREMPLLAFATFNTDGITDTGASPENVAAIAEGFHCTAVGVNCSTGPEPMVEIVRKMAQTGSIHVAVQPNAGLPQLKNGRNTFPLSPKDMAPFVPRFIEAGATIIGGCCGTTPEYIRLVKEAVTGATRRRQPDPKPGRTLISSLSRSVRIGGQFPFVAIGERMNPSGRKKLSDSLKQGDLSLLLADAEAQMQVGAQVMDLNVGVPLADEPALMRTAVVAVQNKYPVPLMIDSANSHALDAGASVYYGRPLLNSLNAEDEKLEEMVPIQKKHGAAVVALLTGVDVPVTAEERMKNAAKMADLLFGKHGLREEDIVFDCLGLVVSAMREGSRETLRTIEMIKRAYPRAATTLGLSNVSFGLPNRKFVHGAFVACAAARGLDSAIMSVTDPVGRILAGAADMFGTKEGAIQAFMQEFTTPVDVGGTPKLPSAEGSAPALGGAAAREPEFVSKLPENERGIFRGIVEGNKDQVERLVTEFASTQPQRAMELFIQVMTPAIRHLGDLFGARIKFIPHLIAAAEAMKTGAKILEPLLMAAREKASGGKKGCIIFATVKGDIHDIGKNICILMLRNFGFEVIDLGRNVEAELILRTAIEKQAQIVALSALMTTTMIQMKVIIDLVRERQLPFKVIIGGAVVTPEFAREIQADGYSTDVGTVVSEMERILSLLEAAGVR
jgi:5-methyltetrahydrofolate--homocysteine methyltransferase